MAEQVKTTEFYSFPLSWENYPTDRLLIEEAFERIDSAINDLSGDSANDADNVGYSDPGGTTISVQTALDTVYARTNTFEIAVNATTASDVGEILWTFAATRKMQFPANLVGSGSIVKQLTGPVDLTIQINVNGVQQGAIVIAANVVTFDVPDDIDIEIGDEVEFVSANNVTFQTIALTIRVNRPD